MASPVIYLRKIHPWPSRCWGLGWALSAGRADRQADHSAGGEGGLSADGGNARPIKEGGLGAGRDIPRGSGGAAWPGAGPSFPGGARAAAEAGPRARGLAPRAGPGLEPAAGGSGCRIPGRSCRSRSRSCRELEDSPRRSRSRAPPSSPPGTGRSAGLGTDGGRAPRRLGIAGHHGVQEPGLPRPAGPGHGLNAQEIPESARKRKKNRDSLSLAWAPGREKSRDFTWHRAELPGAY